MEISEKAKKLIENKTLVIGTIGQLGPNVTPVAACKVVDNKIIITDNYLGITKDNILNNQQVAVAVWDDSIKGKEYGFKFYGKAEYFIDGKWLEFVKGLDDNKGMPNKGTVVFTPEIVKEI